MSWTIVFDLSANSTDLDDYLLLVFQVDIEFEAVMLDANRDKTSKIWIHAKSKACR